jgi:RNA polymerase sigma-70 factor (ECF subfamily)
MRGADDNRRLAGPRQAGDGPAFQELTEPYRSELQAHCYRMLASAQDAEDAVQDTMLAAWQSLGSFQERASLRTWLYRIATNRCLNVLRAASRRPAVQVPAGQGDPAKPPAASSPLRTGLGWAGLGARPQPNRNTSDSRVNA